MLRSQLPAATTRHLGDWNTIWENYFLDYTSSLRKICCVVKEKDDLVAFVKQSLQILPVHLWASLPLPSPCHAPLFAPNSDKIRTA